MAIKYQRVMEVREVSTLRSKDDRAEDFKFRVEVIEDCPGGFFARVWRRETYELTARFGAKDGGNLLTEGEILVLDQSFEWSSLHGGSVDGVFDFVLTKLNELFSA